MADLRQSVAGYLQELQRRGASPHTVRSYGSDLEQLLEYVMPPGTERRPEIDDVSLPVLREWLAYLYDAGLTAISVRRKVAAVRAYFHFLLEEGHLATNPAARLRTPKAKRTIPDVMSAEKTNNLIDAVEERRVAEQPSRERDLALLEMLYGCGLRVSELVGIDLQDVDLASGWVRVRGKGDQERQIPVAGRAVAAVERYLGVRETVQESALFLNSRGKRLGDRQVRRLVKLYALLATGDPTVHPHSFRHAYATHLLRDGADLRSIQELLGHARVSTTQQYTQVSLADLQAVYDRAHPKA